MRTPRKQNALRNDLILKVLRFVLREQEIPVDMMRAAIAKRKEELRAKSMIRVQVEG